MTAPRENKEEWPEIRRDLVEELRRSNDQMKLVADRLAHIQDNLQNHHDVLYGFRMKDTGEWRDGVLQLMSDYRIKQKETNRRFSIAFTAGAPIMMAAAWDFLTKIVKIITGSGGGSPTH